jgi:hypothetical protein
MNYAQLLERLKKFGVGQISRMTSSDQDVALIGRLGEAVFPFGGFLFYPIYLDEGKETIIDPAVVEAILRKFEIEKSDFEP